MQRNQRSPDLLIGAQATVHDLKQRACSELAETAQQNYGFTNGFPSGDLASIVLSSGSHGQLDFEPSTTVSSLCRPNEVIVATVPAPPKDRNAISSTLASPIHSHLNSLFQSHTNAITADLFQRFDEVVESAKKEREELKVALRVEREELKAALKVEREKREELRAALRAEREKREELKTALTVERERREAALKVEREKREELKTALKVERERREEALKVEWEKWEKALKVEREEPESEKADASKRYEHLRNHLLEVEETTLDTVGWLANDDTKMLDRIKLRHLLNRGQEMLAVAAGLTNSSFGASLAWREALGSLDDLSTRLAEARALFDRPGVNLDQPTRAFLSSPEGLVLVVEAKSRSSIRLWRQSSTSGDRPSHAFRWSYLTQPVCIGGSWTAGSGGFRLCTEVVMLFITICLLSVCNFCFKM